jgi:hypothetical protein
MTLSVWILTVRRSDRIEQWIAAREYPDLTELLLKGSFRVGLPVLMGLGVYLIVGVPGAHWLTPLPSQVAVVLALVGFGLLFFSRYIQAYGIQRSRRTWYLFESERRFVASACYLWLLRVVGLVFGSVALLGLLLSKTR